MTLTEINYYVRQYAPIGVIMLLVVVIIIVAFNLLGLYFKQGKSGEAIMPVGPALDTKFDKIKPPIIPKSRSSKGFTFTLDTLDATAGVEEATDSAQVYFIPKKSPTFGFRPQIFQMARAVGIDTEVTNNTLADNVAVFDDGKNSLTVDITTYNFKYEYQFSKDSSFGFDNTYPVSETSIRSQASTFLSKVGRYPTELSQGNSNFVYHSFSAEQKKIQTLDEPEGANIIEIDYYRPDIGSYPLVTSSYYNSPHYVLFALTAGGPVMIRAQVQFFEQSNDQVGIYPIRSGDDAWKALLAGEGYVISSEVESGPVKIKKVTLAYYDPDVYQEYLQPVYVFLGDSRFVAYVPAVSADYIIK